MIGSLRGVVLDRTPKGELIVEAKGTGMGYRIVPAAGAASTVEVGSELFVWISHHIREDAQTLYAFDDRSERMSFEALIGAHGVGPSLALAILSVHRPAALQRVLAEDDIAALCLVPGVGKKTAARLLIELKSRLDIGDIDPSVVSASDGVVTTGSGGTMADVRAALSGFGYTDDEIASALRTLPVEPDASVQEVLRHALQRLAVAR